MQWSSVKFHISYAMRKNPMFWRDVADMCSACLHFFYMTTLLYDQSMFYFYVNVKETDCYTTQDLILNNITEPSMGR